ncbi:hypothetical protein F5Y09DRAFT_279266 [Xylaria sp. FL1042]|nr:hypothetical protein F5Y09DRAFT_279266 [Xylaria sp. FL1042]
MDPLSVASAVAGLLTAAHEVVKLLGPYISASRKTPAIAVHVRDEAESTRAVLVGLQTLVQELTKEVPRGGSLVNVDQVVIILTGGVLLFAELEGAVRSLIAVPPLLRADGDLAARALSPTQYRLPLWTRMQWARQEESLGSLLARLQGFKVSVTAVLTLLQCDTDRRAEQLQMELAANISALLDSNRDLSRRMMQLEDAFDSQTIRSQRPRDSVSAETVMQSKVEVGVAIAMSSSETGKTSTSSSREYLDPDAAGDKSLVSSWINTAASASGFVSQSAFEFESDLEASRVYRRAKRDTMDFSFRTSIAHTHAWSMLSGCSLADVSVLSVIALPLDLEEVTNSHHYVDNSYQQLSLVVEDGPPQSDPETSITEQNSIFQDCLRIHSKLIRIPGFQELFDKQWREQGVDVATIRNWEDNNELWQHLDLFGAFKIIFQKDEAYRLLVEKLGRNLAEEVHQYLNHSSYTAGNRAMILFQALCDKLGFRIDVISCISSASLDDNVGFFKVLDCVKRVLDLLARDGTIYIITDEGNLDALIARVMASSPLPKSPYRHALITFINAQWAFVRDLLDLVGALEQLEKSIQKAPLLELDYPHISSSFFSNYANSEIELLLTVERMLLVPLDRHLWASAVLRWSTTAETHCALTVMKEQDVKQALRSIFEQHRVILETRWGNDQTIRETMKLVTSCTELLSRPSQMFSRTADFFQQILAMLLGGSAGHEMVSSAQKEDFSESQQLLKCARRTVDEKIIRQNELDQTLEDLILRIEDLKGHKIELFGRLIDAGHFIIITSRRKRAQMYNVYLFEKIVLCALENKPVVGIRRKSSRILKAGDVAEESSKLRLVGRVFLRDITDITRLSQNGKLECFDLSYLTSSTTKYSDWRFIRILRG